MNQRAPKTVRWAGMFLVAGWLTIAAAVIYAAFALAHAISG